MNIAIQADLHVAHAADHHDDHHDTSGNTLFGFWIYLMTDCILLLITFALGCVFIAMEVYEFHHLIEHGNGPDRSAFLSAFFALVGMHGLHVTAGLIWMLIMMVEVLKTGLTNRSITRLSCLSLFWHFLDIVWVCVFTVVYLLGVL